MLTLRFSAKSPSDDVTERDFTIGDVPGVLWSPASGAGPAPLILMGHGGGNHKKHPAMPGRAHRLVTERRPIVSPAHIARANAIPGSRARTMLPPIARVPGIAIQGTRVCEGPSVSVNDDDHHRAEARDQHAGIAG
jgi:hypothetical protein